MAGCGAALASFFFEYDTPRIVLIRSRKLGLMNRGVQLFILAYIVGWVFVWEKGYQVKDSVISSVITKVKGVSVTNTSNMGLHVWDGANYMVPVQKDNSLFIMTNMIVTLNQRQNTCADFPNAKTKCNSDDDCSQGSMQVQGSGVETGRCVHFNAQVKTCEVIGWCPVENDTYVPRPAMLNAAENFTIMVKNLIWYPKFNFTKRNILPSFNNTYLKSCIYDAKTDPLCPIFRIGHIAQLAGQNFQEMAVKGGILGISIDWDCNLDWAFSYCLPKYSFRRLDDQGFNYTVSSGYNFRFAKFFRDANGTEVRTLFKAFGIRFDILVFGKAGKFDIIPTMINIGSGLGLFGVATVLCDVIVLYFMKKKYYYREKKFKYVEDYDQGLTETFRTE